MALQLGRRASFIFCLVFLAAASYAADSICPPASPPVPASRLLYLDRKSTRLNSSHRTISYAVFCLKKKTNCPCSPCSLLGRCPLNGQFRLGYCQSSDD